MRHARIRARRAVLALLVLGGCSDDEHKGSVSHGPTAAATGTSAPEPTVRLIYSPKSPLTTMRVAEIAKKRLAKTGARVKIGGETIHVDAPTSEVEAAKGAMAGGRLDLWIAAEDELAAEAGTDELALKTETVATADGPKARRHLEAPPELRDALLQQGERHAGRAKVLVGPSGAPGGLLRTFLVEPGKMVRGEFVASARALQQVGGARLTITFDGSGRNFVRWNGKQKASFVLEVDGQVASVIHPGEEQPDGSLTFVLAGWSLDDAQKLAAALDGVALSHLTVLESESKQ
jgi:hypothetical protein